MEHLRCVVERITYQNADNGYTVLKCAVKNYSDLVTETDVHGIGAGWNSYVIPIGKDRDKYDWNVHGRDLVLCRVSFLW